MLRACRGLSETELASIAILQARVVAADGGRLKLEWPNLWGRSGERVEDFCWFDGDELVGFLGIYSFGGSEPELAGMVDPSHRRAGIGTALVHAALDELGTRDRPSALLVCPRTGAGGDAFARALGGVPEHSEHALALNGPPADGPPVPGISLRAGTADDVPAIRQILMDGFGFGDDEIAGRIDSEEDHVVVLDEHGTVIGYLRTAMTPGDRDTVPTGSVYGFAIAADRRGQGVGRDVLRRTCLDLLDRGAQRVTLEVATDNESALGLYTSLGFEPVITEDYFRLTVRE